MPTVCTNTTKIHMHIRMYVCMHASRSLSNSLHALISVFIVVVFFATVVRELSMARGGSAK